MNNEPARFALPSDYQERVDSIHKIVKFLVHEPDGKLHPRVRRRFLDRCIWQLTEAKGHGKYDLQYVSADAKLDVEDQRKGWKKGLRHDHVWTRNSLLKRLEAPSAPWEEILKDAIGCVVTIDEHMQLSQLPSNVEGWDRYRKAKVRVFDRVGDRYLGW